MTLPSTLTEGTKCIVVYKGTIGVTGNNPNDPIDAGIAIAAKTFTLRDGPDWSQMVWDTANFYSGDSASGSASGNAVQFNLAGAANGSSSAIAEVHGSLSYTGGGAICKIKITLGQSSNSDFGIAIIQDSNLVLEKRLSDLTPGENEFVFPIACGVNSTIEVGENLFGFPDLMGIAYAGSGSLSLSFTLSN